MAWSLQGAIALSIANKAKTHGAGGILIIVEAHLQPYSYHWTLHSFPNGKWIGRGCGSDFGVLRKLLAIYRITPEEERWVPLEASEEEKEGTYESQRESSDQD